MCEKPSFSGFPRFIFLFFEPDMYKKWVQQFFWELRLTGLEFLPEYFKDLKTYKRFLLRYFFEYLLGFFILDENITGKHIFSAHWFYFNEQKSLLYSREIINVVKSFAYAMNYFKQDSSSSYEYITHVFDAIIRLISICDKQYTVFLNATTSLNQYLYHYLQSYPIYLIVRDPRSNYVSNSKYQSNNKSLEWFIPYYKQQRERFDLLLSNYKNIKLINYEEFVICDSVRDSIVKEIGLDKKYYQGQNYFNPAKSIKNCSTYIDYDDVDKINTIYEHLKGYCIDIE